MRLILAIIAIGALAGACTDDKYGYGPERSLRRTAADRDPMVGPVRATNARTMYDRLGREMPLGGPKSE